MPRDINRPKGRPSNTRVVSTQWPRKYGKKVKATIQNKAWELRNYLPKVQNENTSF
jgi:hypothetical protein